MRVYNNGSRIYVARSFIVYTYCLKCKLWEDCVFSAYMGHHPIGESRDLRKYVVAIKKAHIKSYIRDDNVRECARERMRA